jgi:23S rRNA pseudouridine2457 synthase
VAHRYILFYKPYNVLSQFTDVQPASLKPDQPVDSSSNASSSNASSPAGRATLKDFVPVPGVYAVGRLDRDSEGLLLLTDDGPMQHRLSHPKFAHRRQYWVQVERQPTEQALAQLRRGVVIKGYCTRPAEVKTIAEPDLPPRDPPIRYRQNIPTAWLELTLTEGKNRQVRRMTAAVGFPTLRLVRSAIFLLKGCALTTQGLQPGQWRQLTDAERRSLPQR